MSLASLAAPGAPGLTDKRCDFSTPGLQLVHDEAARFLVPWPSSNPHPTTSSSSSSSLSSSCSSFLILSSSSSSLVIKGCTGADGRHMTMGHACVDGNEHRLRAKPFRGPNYRPNSARVPSSWSLSIPWARARGSRHGNSCARTGHAAPVVVSPNRRVHSRLLLRHVNRPEAPRR